MGNAHPAGTLPDWIVTDPSTGEFRGSRCDQCHLMPFNVQLSTCGHTMCLGCFKRNAKPHWLSRYLPYRTLNLPLAVQCKATSCVNLVSEQSESDRVLVWSKKVRDPDKRNQLIDLAERFALANDTSTWGRKVMEIVWALAVFGVCELVWWLSGYII